MKKIIVGGLVIVFFLGVVGHLLKTKYDSMLVATSQGMLLGEKFGRKVEQSDCITGLRFKYSVCDTTECELSAGGYIEQCMKTAKKDAFCSNVPRLEKTQESVNWVLNECNKNNLGETKCLKYMHEFVKVCSEQKENRKLSDAELIKSSFDKSLVEKTK